MCLALAYAEMRVGCCQKQDLRDGEDFHDGWVEVVVRNGICGTFGFRTIERPWPGTIVQRVVFGSCQLLRPVMTILGGKTVMTR